MSGPEPIIISTPELVERVSLLLSELGETCLNVQSGISTCLDADSRHTANLETLQEIDRVTQTLFCLAEFLRKIDDTAQSPALLDIAHALSTVTLRKVALHLNGDETTSDDSGVATDNIELF